MSISLQKANLWKRISAWMFDFILVAILAIGVASGISGIVRYDRYNAQLTQHYVQAFQNEGIEKYKDITQEEYDKLSEDDKTKIDNALKAYAENENVVKITKRQFYLSLVIIGGGLTGCEIAYELYLQGKKPTIVEMKDDLIAVKGVCLANSSYLRDFFNANKVPVHLETKLQEVFADGVQVVDKDGKSFKIDADSVILSVGYVPAPLAPKGKHVHVVGDASKVGNLRTVIWQASDVAMKL